MFQEVYAIVLKSWHTMCMLCVSAIHTYSIHDSTYDDILAFNTLLL